MEHGDERGEWGLGSRALVWWRENPLLWEPCLEWRMALCSAGHRCDGQSRIREESRGEGCTQASSLPRNMRTRAPPTMITV